MDRAGRVTRSSEDGCGIPRGPIHVGGRRRLLAGGCGSSGGLGGVVHLHCVGVPSSPL